MPNPQDDFSITIVKKNETQDKEYQEFRQVNLASIDADIITTAISQALSLLGYEQAKDAGADPKKLAVFAEMLGIKK